MLCRRQTRQKVWLHCRVRGSKKNSRQMLHCRSASRANLSELTNFSDDGSIAEVAGSSRFLVVSAHRTINAGLFIYQADIFGGGKGMKVRMTELAEIAGPDQHTA